MIKFFLLIWGTITLAIAGGNISFASDSCEIIKQEHGRFSNPSLQIEKSDRFIAYMEALIEQNVLKEKHIEIFVSELEKGKVINPISEVEALSNATLSLQFEGLASFLKDPSHLDIGRLIDWAKPRVRREKKEKKEKEVVRSKTAMATYPILLAKVQPGKFMMGKPHWDAEVTITKPYFIQSTQVTQYQYSLVMGENPSHFVKGGNAISLSFRGKSIEMLPDHPVERVNSSDAEAFIQRLNKLILEEDPLVRTILPNHKPGLIYRLPTAAEWEFALRYGGRSSPPYPLVDKPEKMTEYGWLPENAENTTHPVGELKPVMVGEFPVYDPVGNVSEWMGTRHMGNVSEWARNVKPENAAAFYKDPDPGTMGMRELRTSDYKQGGNTYSFRGQDDWNGRWPTIGFRLAASLP